MTRSRDEPAARPSATDVVDDSRRLAERLGAGRYDLECVGLQMLTPRMRRIELHSEDLASFSYEAGQDLMVTIAAEAGSIVRRRYTIRLLDQTDAVIAIDVVLHAHGPGARWATTVAPGDRVEAIGPRGKVSVMTAGTRPRPTGRAQSTSSCDGLISPRWMDRASLHHHSRDAVLQPRCGFALGRGAQIRLRPQRLSILAA